MVDNYVMPAIMSIGVDCCGCGSCLAICPKNAISFKEGSGFDYPVLDSATCVGCLKCEKVCPVLSNRTMQKGVIGECFWAVANESIITDNCSSGGIFPLLAYRWIEDNGVVYGAAFMDDYLKVKHIRVTCKSDLKSLFCSKYVQSEVSSKVYESLLKDLKCGKKVLFSGTGCQICAAKNYLELCNVTCFDNLLFIEVICGGVPSPYLWKKWVTSKGPLSYINMRNKSTGWESYSIRYDCAEATQVVTIYDDWYMRAFLARATQRPSCFNCPSRGAFRSDIVIGDFWRVFIAHPEADRSKGVSAVLIVSDRGMDAFRKVEQSVKYGQSSVGKIESGNHCLFSSPNKAKCHDELLADLDQLSIEELVAKYPLNESKKKKLRRFLGKTARQLLAAFK